MHRRTRTAGATGKHHFAAALATATLAVCLLAGCGGSSDGVATSTSTDADATGRITIPHRFGDTVLDGTPHRIVSLDTQWTDVLTALHGPLVGAAGDPTVEGGRFPWQRGLPSSVADIEVPKALAIPYEGIAAQHPDLIVVTWAAAQRSDYDKLSRIAPTVPSLDDQQVEPWQKIATVAGKILGRPGAAKQLIDDVDAKVDAFAEALPGLKGKTYAFANYVAGDGFTVVADPNDGSAHLFAELGMKIDPELVKLAGGSTDRVELSLENVGELDADVLILLTNGADPSEIPGYDDLPAVRTGAVALIDYAEATALNTPSPLSIPWVLGRIRPALVEAAK